MKIVEPIRDRKKIEEIKSILIQEKNYRDLLFFVGGINFALRITDLLQLKIKDLFHNGEIREYFDVIEKKTKKKNRIFITDGVKIILKDYVAKYPYVAINPDNYLFFTQNGKKAFTRKWAGLILKKLAYKVGIIENIGTHSLRKTWGFQARQNNISMSLIQNKLNHSSMKTTERYLGITAEEVGKACLDLNL